MIRIRLVPCNGSYHVRCALCGERMETTWHETPKAFDGDEDTGDACPVCATADEATVRQRIQEQAERLRGWADELTRLCGEPFRPLSEAAILASQDQADANWRGEGPAFTLADAAADSA